RDTPRQAEPFGGRVDDPHPAALGAGFRDTAPQCPYRRVVSVEQRGQRRVVGGDHPQRPLRLGDGGRRPNPLRPGNDRRRAAALRLGDGRGRVGPLRLGGGGRGRPDRYGHGRVLVRVGGLLQDDVGVDAAEAEGVDAGAAGGVAAFPGSGGGGRGEAGAVEFGAGVVAVQGRGQDATVYG